MIAFEVSVNGKRHCVAGIGDNCVLNAIVGWGSKPPSNWLDVGGLNSDTRHHLRWTPVMLKVGGEVTVRVVDVENPDAPFQSYPAKESV
jgi:hypothetical protein